MSVRFTLYFILTSYAKLKFHHHSSKSSRNKNRVSVWSHGHARRVHNIHLSTSAD